MGPLAVDRLRGRHDHLLDRQPLGDDQLVEEGGAHAVGEEEPREVGEIVLVRGEVKDRFDAPERAVQDLAIGHPAVNELDVRRNVLRAAAHVHGRFE